jgi:hypothetical protein
MNHRESHNVLAVTLGTLVALGAACGSGADPLPDGGGSSGGWPVNGDIVSDVVDTPSDATGTASSSSSSSGSSSSSSSSSGSSSGSSGGDAAVGSSGGETASGSSSSSGNDASSGSEDAGPPPPTCQKPSACLKHPDTPYCSILEGYCVECLIDLHCPTTGNCEQFKCKDVKCVAGTKECKGGFISTCAKDGKNWDQKPCPDSYPYCLGDQCRLCLPGEKFCAKPPASKQYSNVVLKCNGSGSDADFVLKCEGATVCIDGKCQVCVPGLKRCHNGNAQMCKLDGSGWSIKDNCVAKDLGCLGGLCVDPCGSDFKSNTNVGCDYWAVDLDNAQVPCGPKLCDAQNMQYSVIISNTKNKNAKVTISTGAGKVSQHLIPPLGLKVINLPDPAWGLAKPLSLDGTSITTNAYRISSSVPIVAYQFNPLANDLVFSNDASLLLPTNVIGNEYYVMTRQQNHSNLRGYLTVIGVQKTGTTVQILPSCKTLPGKDLQGKSIPGLQKGQLLKVTLGQGEVLNLESNENGGDLTGSRIIADAPVAVFAGSEGSNVPDTNKCVKAPGQAKGVCQFQGWPCATNKDCPVTCCADHLEEQLFPVKAWGNVYVASKFKKRGLEKDVWRILAGTDNTVVTTIPQQVPAKSLKKGEWFEFESATDFEIKASHPVMVGHFMTSANAPDPKNDECTGKFSGYKVCKHHISSLPDENKCTKAAGAKEGKCSAGGWPTCSTDSDCPTQEPITCKKHSDCPNIKQKDDAQIGDPAFVLTVATDRYLKNYIFLVPDKYKENYVNVVAPSTAVVTLDNVPIAASKFVGVGPNWKVARLPIGPGKHSLVGAQPIAVVVYGYDKYVSYAYPGGAALK